MRPNKKVLSMMQSCLEEEGMATPQTVSVFLRTQGSLNSNQECNLFAYFNGIMLLETQWISDATYEIDELPVNLLVPEERSLISDYPLVILLRNVNVGGKPTKEQDPLLHPENRAGASVDLFPLLLGEDQVYVGVYLVMLNSGELSGCKVTVFSSCTANIEKFQIPLTMTMLSAHCLPLVKDGTVFLSAIGLDGITDHVAYNFGMSLSTSNAKKVVWVLPNNCGYLSNTNYDVLYDDTFIPEELELQNQEGCSAYYWNSMKRVLLDPSALAERLNSSFMIEIAGVPKAGKIDIRGRYMGFVDAGVLLQPGQNTVTTCVKLQFYREANLPEGLGPLLHLPPMSAKASARDKDVDEIFDENGHSAYVIIRFDLPEPLVQKPKILTLYNTIGIPEPNGLTIPMDALYLEPPPKDPNIDIRKIRENGYALGVHDELTALATAVKGNDPKNPSAKHTQANRLLLKVRTMLKQFAPGEGLTKAEWQDSVTAQHSAARQAVLASFEPRSLPHNPSPRAAEARSRMAGDDRIANKHNVKKLSSSPNHPRTMLSNVLRSLENEKWTQRKIHEDLIHALRIQCNNRFILWTLGAQGLNRPDNDKIAEAALRIAVKGDSSDGTTKSIGWAALHAFYHSTGNVHAAFKSAKKMRKSFELQMKWKKIYNNWREISGEEESYWMPNVISEENPFIMASALFVCLRCFHMAERLLLCAEEGCLSRGSRLGLPSNILIDNYYIRAALYLLTQEIDKAIDVTEKGIKEFGPSGKMIEMRATCLMKSKTWDKSCALAVKRAEQAGAEVNPSLLLQAAQYGYKTDPATALQRAARCHKLAPSAFSALTLAKIYDVMGNKNLAERWGAAAVKLEPLLADGWAFLCILALRERNVDLANHLLRTAKQVGPVSNENIEEIQRLRSVANIENIPEAVMSEFCYCTDCY